MNDETIGVWRRLLAAADKTWVGFANDTVVVVPEGESDPAGYARSVLGEVGPVRPGAPSADFQVATVDSVPCWVIGGCHPDVLTLVSNDECGPDSPEAMVGLYGRSKREADCQSLEVVHVERPKRVGIERPAR